MIIASIKKWVPIAGLVHNSTTWELASDPNFENIIERKEASTEKDVFYSEIIVPLDAIYYIRGLRHMSDSKADFYSDTIIVTGKREHKPGIILLEDFYIDTPSVFIDMEEYNNEGSFEIRSSRFRGNINSHDYTHWIVLDSFGKTLFTSLYNNKDKISIVVPIATEIRSKNNVEIYCIHGSYTGIESHPGKYKIGSIDSNFEVTSNLGELKSFKDNEITFKAIDPSKGIGISEIYLMDGSQNDKVIRTWKNITGIITIPWYESIPGGNMFLRFRFINNVDKTATIDKPLSFISNYNTDIRYPNGIFRVELSKYTDNPVQIVKPISNVITDSSFNNDIFIPVTDTQLDVTKLYNYRVDTKDKRLKCVLANMDLKTDSSAVINNALDFKAPTDGMYIKHVHGDMLLIDALNSDGYPTFTFVQKHPNPSSGREYYALHQTIRQDETKSLGHTGGIVPMGDECMIYIPVGSKVIKKYNLRNGSIEKLADIPEDIAGTSKHLTLFKLEGQNKIVILGGDKVETMIYNYAENKFEESIYISPVTFTGIAIKCIQLQNGDTIIMKSEPSTDTDNDILLYHTGDSRPTITNLRFSRDIDYPSVIVLRPDLRVDFLSDSSETIVTDSNINYPNTKTYYIQAFE